MSIPLKVNNVTYNYPQESNEGWGADATNWAVAITQGTLQKQGGLFALTADVDFGPNFGLKSVYFKSRSANIASTGTIRLSNTDSIQFRNSLNSANLSFGPGSTDTIPQYAGIDLVNLSDAQSLSNKTLVAPVITGGITVTGNLTVSGTITASNFTGSSSGTNTGDVTIGTANGLSILGQVLSLGLSSTSTNGALSSTDWNTFNNKQAAGNYFVNGGNSFGVAQSLGSNDAFGLTLKTNNTAQVVIDTSGNMSVTGAIRGPNNNSSVPSISFTGETSSGWYRPGSGQVTFSILGADNIAYTASAMSVLSKVLNTSGAVALPSYSFTSDTSAGIYLPAAGTVAFAVGGTNSLSYTNADIRPFLPLLAQNGSVGSPVFSFINSTDTGIYRPAANQIGFTNAGVASALLDGSGHLNLLGQRELRLQDTTGGEYVGLRASGTQSTYTITLPAAAPSANTALTYDGANYVWAASGGGGGVTSLNTQTGALTLVAGSNISITPGAGTLTIAATGTGSFPLLAPNGTAGAPSYSFSSDATTGIFLSGGSLAFSFGGSQKAQINSTGLEMSTFVVLPDGAAATPILTFGSDLDTGLYRSASNTLAVSAGATLIAEFKAASLDLTGSIRLPNNNSATPSLAFTAETNTGLYRPTAGQIQVSILGFDAYNLSATGISTIGAGGTVVNDNLVSATLADNTTGAVVASYVAASNSAFIVEYSLIRGANRETGTLQVVSDGSTVNVAKQGASIGTLGVSFTGDISGANVRLLYTTTSTGSSASMKFIVRRWLA